jgi:hypothetical protein
VIAILVTSGVVRDFAHIENPQLCRLARQPEKPRAEPLPRDLIQEKGPLNRRQALVRADSRGGCSGGRAFSGADSEGRIASVPPKDEDPITAEAREMAAAYGIDTAEVSTMADLYELLLARQRSPEHSASPALETDGEAPTLRLEGRRDSEPVPGPQHRAPERREADVEGRRAPHAGTRPDLTLRGDANLDEAAVEPASVEDELPEPRQREPTDVERWTVGRLRLLLDRAKDGEVDALKRARAAYEAAVGWPPEREWERRLRLSVADALFHRQAGLEQGAGRPAMTTGLEIAAVLPFQCPRGTVPAGLTAEKIERVLRRATLAPDAQPAERQQHYQSAVDGLVRELGFEPLQPPSR